MWRFGSAGSLGGLDVPGNLAKRTDVKGLPHKMPKLSQGGSCTPIIPTKCVTLKLCGMSMPLF
jgi:hypothetical protein